MKKLVLGLFCALLLTSFAACTGSEGENGDAGESAETTASTADALAPEQILSVRQISTGKILTVGDSEAVAEDIVDGIPDTEIHFELDNVTRLSYGEPGIAIDWLDGEVVSLSLSAPDWEISSGARVGMTKDEIRALYSENAYADEGTNDFVVCYDKEMNPIEYTPDAYYMTMITFDGEGGTVDYIGIITKISEEKMLAAQQGE